MDNLQKYNLLYSVFFNEDSITLVFDETIKANGFDVKKEELIEFIKYYFAILNDFDRKTISKIDNKISDLIKQEIKSCKIYIGKLIQYNSENNNIDNYFAVSINIGTEENPTTAIVNVELHRMLLESTQPIKIDVNSAIYTNLLQFQKDLLLEDLQKKYTKNYIVFTENKDFIIVPFDKEN